MGAAIGAYGDASFTSLWVSGLDDDFNLFLLEVRCRGVVFRIHSSKRFEPTLRSMVDVPFVTQ